MGPHLGCLAPEDNLFAAELSLVSTSPQIFRCVPYRSSSRFTMDSNRVSPCKIRYAASLLCAIIWRERTLETLWQWLELFGGKAAWPAMFDLFIVLLPAQRVAKVLDFYYFGTNESKWDVDSPGIGTKTTLVNLHTKASITMAIWIAIHGVLCAIAYLIRDPADFWATMVPLTKYLTEGIYNFMGTMAGVSDS